MQIGYKLSSEEHGLRRLVGYAARAESIRMRFALISDRFHPWIGRQRRDKRRYAGSVSIVGAPVVDVEGLREIGRRPRV